MSVVIVTASTELISSEALRFMVILGYAVVGDGPTQPPLVETDTCCELPCHHTKPTLVAFLKRCRSLAIVSTLM